MQFIVLFDKICIGHFIILDIFFKIYIQIKSVYNGFNVNTECALMRSTKFVIISLSFYCPKSYYYIIVEIVIRDTIQFVKSEISSSSREKCNTMPFCKKSVCLFSQVRCMASIFRFTCKFARFKTKEDTSY